MSVPIIDTLSRGASGASEFPISVQDDLKLAFLTVNNLTERQNIPEWKRLPFMTVYVISENAEYTLGNDITIGGQSWTPKDYGLPTNVVTEDEIFDVNGYIQPQLIQNVFLNSSYVVASEAAMLALTSYTGNFFIRTDTSQVYIKLNNDNPADIGDFALATNPASVISVNGQIGVVNITIANLLAVPQNVIDFNIAVTNSTTVLDHSSAISVLQGDVISLEADLTALETYVNTNLGTKLLSATAQNPTLAQDGYVVKWDNTLNQYVLAQDATLGDGTFLGLLDTPSSYTGQSGKFLRVNVAENALEFLAGTGGGHVIQASGTPLTSRTYLNVLNGLTASDDAGSDATLIKLGGTLTGNTLIDTATNKLTLSSNGTTGGRAELIIDQGAGDAVDMTVWNVAGTEYATIGVSNLGGGQLQARVEGSDPGFQGLQYDNNYSANFTSFSLINKGYADATYSTIAGAAYTASNGITKTVNNFKLGGTLIENTVINGAFDIDITSSTLDITTTGNSNWSAGTGSFYISASGASVYIDDTQGVEITATSALDTKVYYNGGGFLATSSNSRQMRLQSGSTQSNVIYYTIQGGTTPTAILEVGTSVTTFAGLQYGVNYSANYTDRSLIDRGYANTTYAPISGGSNYWKNAGTTSLTSAATVNTTNAIEVGYVSGLITHVLQTDLNGVYLYSDNNGTDTATINTTTTQARLVGYWNSNETYLRIGKVGAASEILVSSTYTTFAGIKYNADYSANYTDRSLIDRGYANATYATISGATYTASNGITKTVNNFALGGALTANTTITGASTYGLFLGTAGSPLAYSEIAANGLDLTAPINNIRLETEDASGQIIFTSQNVVRASTTYNWQALGSERRQLDVNYAYMRMKGVDFGTNYTAAAPVNVIDLQIERATGAMPVDVTMMIPFYIGGGIGFSGAVGAGIKYKLTDNTTGAHYTKFIHSVIINHVATDIVDLDRYGWRYLADYSANYTDRSLIDRGWANATYALIGGAPAAHTLDSHSNVTITANSAGEILKWSGSAWINNTLAEAGIQPTLTPAALTKTDDTNVTLTLGGTPTTALLQATSLTLGWTGTLADGRITSAATWNAKIGGTITDNQIAVGAVSANTIEGAAGLTWDGTTFTVNGGTVVGSATTQNIFNTAATTVNLAGAATTFSLGGTPTTALTANLFTNATATATTKAINIGTAGAAGSTTNVNIGSATASAVLGTLSLNFPTILTAVNNTTVALWNTLSTTINFAGAATTLSIGGTPTTALTVNIATNATATATTKAVNIATAGAAGSTTNVNIGSATASAVLGTLSLNFPTILTASNNLTVALWNTNSTTISFAGAATTYTVGGTPTTALTANIFANATANTVTKTLNIGTAGVSGSITNINIGSAVSGAVGTTIIGGATFRLLNTPATDASFSTSQLLVRDSTGNVDVIAASGGGTTNFLRADGTWAAAGGGFTNLTQFVSQTAWRLFYSDSLGDVVELGFGGAGTYLQSNGATAAPTWVTPGGGGDMLLGTIQTVTAAKNFNDDTLAVWNPAGTFKYIFSSSALITADKTVTLPLLTASDTFVFEAFAQTLTNKTLTSPIINYGSDAAGDIYKRNAGNTSQERLAIGTTDFVLTSDGSAPIWRASAGGVGGGVYYTFSTTTTASDPGSGTVRYNNATPASVTSLYVSNTTSEGLTLTSYFTSLFSGQQILIRQSSDSTKAQVYQVSGAVTDNGAWSTIPVNYVSNGTGGLPGNNKSVGLAKIANSGGGSGWAVTGTTTLTGAVTIAQATFDIGFLNGNILIGPTASTITASTKVDIRGTGSGGGFALRVADVNNVERFKVRDDGLVTIGNDSTVDGIIQHRWSSGNGSIVWVVGGGGVANLSIISNGRLEWGSSGGYIFNESTVEKFRILTDVYISGTTNLGVGINSAITANTRVDIRGIGTTTDTILRVADSANTERFKILGNGEIYGTEINLFGNTAPYSIRIGHLAGSTSGIASNNSLSIGVNANQGTTNIGLSSIAIGKTSRSIGEYDISIGNEAGGTTASGTYATSIGNQANKGFTPGLASIALGNNAYTVGNYSIAIGHLSKSPSTSSIAIGKDAGSTSGTNGIDSISIGNGANIGTHNIASDAITIGRTTKGTGVASVVIGALSEASNTYALSIGIRTIASGAGAIMMGYSNTSLTNAVADSIGFGWNVSSPDILFAKAADSYFNTTANIGFFTGSGVAYNSMTKGFFIGDMGVAPTGNPTAGGYFWVDSTSHLPKWRTPAGVVYTLTDTGSLPADGTYGDITVTGTGTTWTLNATGISGKTAITSVDTAADYLLIWDATDSLLKKVLPSNLGLGGGSGWAVTGTTTLTGAVTIAQATNDIYFLNGEILFGPTAATITASTKVDIRGTGTTTGLALRIADSANTERFKVLDNGTTTITQAVFTTGSPNLITVVGGAHTTLSNAETTDINFNLARTVQFAGNTALTQPQRAIIIQSPTYTSDTATKAIHYPRTVQVDGPPVLGLNTNAIHAAGIWVETKAIGTATIGSAIVGIAPTGTLTSSYAGYFLGNVGMSGRTVIGETTNIYASTYTLYILPVSTSDNQMVNLNGTNLTAGITLHSIGQNATGSWNKGNFGYSSTSSVLSTVQGASNVGYTSRLTSSTGIGLDVVTDSLPGYNQVMARIAHAGGTLTASNANPMLYIARSATTLGAFDMTGAMIELEQVHATTGDFIKAVGPTSAPKFKIDYKGNLFLGDNASASSTATPITIDSGGTYADSQVSSKAKWKLYNDGTPANTYGIGISSSSFNFFVNSGSTYYWLINDVVQARLNATGLMVGGIESPSAKLQVKGAGITTGLAFLVTDSALTERFKILDNGTVNIGNTVGQGSGEILLVNGPIVHNGVTNSDELYTVGDISKASRRVNASSYTINVNAGLTYVFSVGGGTHLTIGESYTALLTKLAIGEIAWNGEQLSVKGVGTTTGITFLLKDSASADIFKVLDNGTTYLSKAPAQDDALTQVLVRDGATGIIKYRASSTLGGAVSLGTAGEIPFVNAGATDFAYSAATFVWNETKKILLVGTTLSAATPTSGYSIIVGENITLSADNSWNAIFGDVHSITPAFNNNIVAGSGLTVTGGTMANSIFVGGATTVSGAGEKSASVIFGESNTLNTSTGTTRYNFIAGSNNSVVGTTIQYAVVFGNNSNATASSAFVVGNRISGTNNILASGVGSINMSSNTTAQTATHGALAASSGIFGGQDHNIPSDSPRSVIIGGNAIKARAAEADQVYVPTLNLDTALANDDALTQVLVRASNGQVKYRLASSLGGGGSPGGADTQVQYNNGGTFGGMSVLTYNDATNLLTYSPTLDEATGDETAFSIITTINKATSGSSRGLLVKMIPTLDPTPNSSTLLNLTYGSNEAVESRFLVYVDGYLASTLYTEAEDLSAVRPNWELGRFTASTPLAGFGNSITSYLTTTTSYETAGEISWQWTTPTNGSRASRIDINTRSVTTVRGIAILSTGQLILKQYTANNSFTGTPVGSLDFDSAGNVLTSPLVTAVANSWGAFNQNIATGGKWQEGGVSISPIGKHDVWIPASAMLKRVTTGSSALTQVEFATSLANLAVLDFDQTTAEFASFSVSLPRNWNNGTITYFVYWTAASGTGTVSWAIKAGAYSNDDPLTTALGTAITTTDTLIATGDVHISDESAALTIAGTPADNDLVVFEISRDIADTLTADARLIGVKVVFTTDAAVTA